MARPTPTPDAVAYVVLEPLEHDGTLYASGATAPALDPDTTAALLARGVIAATEDSHAART